MVVQFVFDRALFFVRAVGFEFSLEGGRSFDRFR